MDGPSETSQTCESTALHCAITAKLVDMVRYLVVEAVADVNLPNNDTEPLSPIRAVAKMVMNATHDAKTATATAEIARILCANGADTAAAADSEGYPPLLRIAYSNYSHKEDLIKAMALAGANVAARRANTGESLLSYYATSCRNVAMMKFLIEHGANVNINDAGRSGIPPLVQFVRHMQAGDMDTLKYLIRHGADVNTPAGNGSSYPGWTPVAMAGTIGDGRLSVTEYLLQVGADITICDRHTGMNALHRAAAADAIKVVTAMCKTMGPAWEHTSRDGLTPVSNAGHVVRPFLTKWAEGAAPWTANGHCRQPEGLHNTVLIVLLAARRRAADAATTGATVAVLPLEMLMKIFEQLAGNHFFFVKLVGRMAAFLKWNKTQAHARALSRDALKAGDEAQVLYLLENGMNPDLDNGPCPAYAVPQTFAGRIKVADLGRRVKITTASLVHGTGVLRFIGRRPLTALAPESVPVGMAAASLADLGVPALKDMATKLGIKTKGVGWPRCCPPSANKAHIVEAITSALSQTSWAYKAGLSAGERLECAAPDELAGVELDLPMGEGDGICSKDGLRYFQTAPKHAVLVNPNAIIFLEENGLLDDSCNYSNGAVVRALVQNHAVDANRLVTAGIYPICHFASKNDVETVKVLLANGADVNAGFDFSSGDFSSGDPADSTEASFSYIDDVGTACWYIPVHAYGGLKVKMTVVEVSNFKGVRVTTANPNANVELSAASAGRGDFGSDQGLRFFWIEGFKLTRTDPYAGSRNIIAVGDRVGHLLVDDRIGIVEEIMYDRLRARVVCNKDDLHANDDVYERAMSELELECGARSSLKPLLSFALHKNTEMVQALLSKFGADPNVLDDLGRSVAYIYAVAGSNGMVKSCVRAGANLGVIYAVFEVGDKVLFSSDVEKLQKCMSRTQATLVAGSVGIVQASQTRDGLMEITAAGNLLMPGTQAQLALLTGVNKDCVVVNKTLVSMFAAKGDDEMVRFLCEVGADPNLGNASAGSPCCEAAVALDLAMLQCLISCGADPSAKGSRGDTPLLTLFTSAETGSPKWEAAIQLLVKHEAGINVATASGQTALMFAAVYGLARQDFGVVKLLLDAGADPNIADTKGNTALHIVLGEDAPVIAPDEPEQPAAFRGRLVTEINPKEKSGIRLAVITSLAEHEGKSTEELRHTYYSRRRPGPSSLAAVTGTVTMPEVVDLLIAAGANINASNTLSRSPVHVAAAYGARICSYWALQKILDSGAGPNQVDGHGNTPFHVLLNAPEVRQIPSVFNESGRSMPLIATLLTPAVDVNCQNTEGESVAVLAAQLGAETGKFDILDRIIDIGADTTIANKQGDTPLHMVIKSSAAHKSLSTSPAPSVPSGFSGSFNKHAPGKTFSAEEVRAKHHAFHEPSGPALDSAATVALQTVKQTLTSIVDKLVAAGANLVAVNSEGSTSLHLAIEQGMRIGDFKIATALIEAGSEINAPDASGNTPLHQLLMTPKPIGANAVALASLLVSREADLNHCNNKGETVIGLAAALGVGYADLFSKIAKVAPDVNSANSAGDTPLHIIARWASEAPANVEAQWAASMSAAPMSLLVSRGANPASLNLKGQTAACIAAASVRQMSRVQADSGVGWEALKVLVDAGADPNLADTNGNAVLHYLCFSEHSPVSHSGTSDVAKIGGLLNRLAYSGANVDAKNSAGNSVLTWVASRDQELMFQLLERGGDVDITDPKGDSLLQIVMRAGRSGATGSSQGNATSGIVAGAMVRQRSTGKTGKVTVIGQQASGKPHKSLGWLTDITGGLWVPPQDIELVDLGNPGRAVVDASTSAKFGATTIAALPVDDEAVFGAISGLVALGINLHNTNQAGSHAGSEAAAHGCQTNDFRWLSYLLDAGLDVDAEGDSLHPSMLHLVLRQGNMDVPAQSSQLVTKTAFKSAPTTLENNSLEELRHGDYTIKSGGQVAPAAAPGAYGAPTVGFGQPHKWHDMAAGGEAGTPLPKDPPAWQMMVGLIARGADVNRLDKSGKSLALIAAETNNFRLLKLLLANGADVNVQTPDTGTTVLQLCLKAHSKVGVAVKDGTEQSSSGTRNLALKAYEESFGLPAGSATMEQVVSTSAGVEGFITLGQAKLEADDVAARAAGSSAMTGALTTGGATTSPASVQLVPIIKSVVRAGANLGVAEKSGATAVGLVGNIALETGDSTMLRFFLEAGADPNVRLRSGQSLSTSLVGAYTERGDQEMVELLCAYGASPNGIVSHAPPRMVVRNQQKFDRALSARDLQFTNAAMTATRPRSNGCYPAAILPVTSGRIHFRVRLTGQVDRGNRFTFGVARGSYRASDSDGFGREVRSAGLQCDCQNGSQKVTFSSQLGGAMQVHPPPVPDVTLKPGDTVAVEVLHDVATFFINDVECFSCNAPGITVAGTTMNSDGEVTIERAEDPALSAAAVIAAAAEAESGAAPAPERGHVQSGPMLVGQGAPAETSAARTAARTEIEVSVSRPSAAARFGFSMTFTPTGAVVTHVDPVGLVALGSSGKVRPGLLLLEVDGRDVTKADRSQLQGILQKAGGSSSRLQTASAKANTKSEVRFRFAPSGYSMVFSTGATPIAAAAKRGLDGIVKCLVDHGADLNVADADGRLPIHYYVRGSADQKSGGGAAIVRLMIEKGADVNIPLRSVEEEPVRGSKPESRNAKPAESAVPPPRLFVSGAAGNPNAVACNGTYEVSGARNGMPLYGKIGGPAIIYWRPTATSGNASGPRGATSGSWKMNHADGTFWNFCTPEPAEPVADPVLKLATSVNTWTTPYPMWTAPTVASTPADSGASLSGGMGGVTANTIVPIPASSIDTSVTYDGRHSLDNLVDGDPTTFWWGGGSSVQLTIATPVGPWDRLEVFWTEHHDRSPLRCLVEAGGRQIANIAPLPRDGAWHPVVERADHPELTAGGATLTLKLREAANNIRVTGLRFSVDEAPSMPAPDVPLVGLIHHYLVERDTAMVRLLIKHGADLNVADQHGNTPVFLAASNGDHDVMRLLVSRGADVNVIGEFGDTLLNMFVFGGDLEMVRYLVKHGADVNLVDSVTGNSPLHIAAANSHLQLVEYLIALRFIEVTVVNKAGKTPGWAAARCGNPTLLELFQQHAAAQSFAATQHAQQEAYRQAVEARAAQQPGAAPHSS